MKITLKTDPETLFLLHRIVLEQSQQPVVGRRSGKSMIVELFEIMSKRCIAYTSNPNGKQRTLVLRYHLADKLLELITDTIVKRYYGTYEHNKLEIFKNQLHQEVL